MKLEKRINAFVKLGLFLGQYETGQKNSDLVELNKTFYDEFDALINRQKAMNGWFDRQNVLHAIKGVSSFLTNEKLTKWLGSYNLESIASKRVGIIMAGNIPLVGFHDYLCVVLVGHHLKAKLSSDDNQLLRVISKIVVSIEPEFSQQISFVEKLEEIDAVIATGSNNTARYFEHYFGKYPNIIRKNRNSVAILNEQDSQEDLEKLSKDVFMYYGLGCRNVSKLYVPNGYDFDRLFKAFFETHQDIINNNKYANNYDYNKAIYLMGKEPILDNNFVLLRESIEITSPVGVLHYEYYDDIEGVKQTITERNEEIQCVVSSTNTPIETVGFGEAQSPLLSDYADNIDTIKFLTQL